MPVDSSSTSVRLVPMGLGPGLDLPSPTKSSVIGVREAREVVTDDQVSSERESRLPFLSALYLRPLPKTTGEGAQTSLDAAKTNTR